MARFERSRGGNRGSRDRSPRSDSRDRSPRRDSGEDTFESHMERGGSRRDSGRRGRDSGRSFGGRDSSRGRFGGSKRGHLEMTKVICSDCGVECEVPFKPTSSKPVYCSECFEKQGKGGSSGHSNRNLEIINEKLDKIMTALKIN